MAAAGSKDWVARRGRGREPRNESVFFVAIIMTYVLYYMYKLRARKYLIKVLTM
jgi:hypothetical protein